MRVIAGSARGTSLSTPRNSGLRPTMGCVKAAMFSSLGQRVVGAKVLDLFSGSGTLGIEALSRGATSANFVERDGAAIASIRDNLKKTHLTGILHQSDVFPFLLRHEPLGGYDLVFADPPYPAKNHWGNSNNALSQLLHLALWPRFLKPDGLFILEMPATYPNDFSPHLELLRARRYGETKVGFFTLRLYEEESDKEAEDKNEFLAP